MSFSLMLIKGAKTENGVTTFYIPNLGVVVNNAIPIPFYPDYGIFHNEITFRLSNQSIIIKTDSPVRNSRIVTSNLPYFGNKTKDETLSAPLTDVIFNTSIAETVNTDEIGIDDGNWLIGEINRRMSNSGLRVRARQIFLKLLNEEESLSGIVSAGYCELLLGFLYDLGLDLATKSPFNKSRAIAIKEAVNKLNYNKRLVDETKIEAFKNYLDEVSREGANVQLAIRNHNLVSASSSTRTQIRTCLGVELETQLVSGATTTDTST